MKLVIIPPYKGQNFIAEQGGHVLSHIFIERMRKKGQLDGVEIDVADGWPVDSSTEARDEEVLAMITPGFLKRVRQYSEMGKYDAIVAQGSIEPGFFAAREISKIPIAFALHSAVHIASLVGERATILEPAEPMAQIIRHYVQNYGFSHKVVSVRTIRRTSAYTSRLARRYVIDGVKDAENQKAVDDAVAQCIAAIEKDRADTLIFGCPPIQLLSEVIRQRLDEAGYQEIQIICELPAAVEMAKAMVNMKLIQSSVAYPSDSLKAKPEFR